MLCRVLDLLFKHMIEWQHSKVLLLKTKLKFSVIIPTKFLFWD